MLDQSSAQLGVVHKGSLNANPWFGAALHGLRVPERLSKISVGCAGLQARDRHARGITMNCYSLLKLGSFLVKH